MAAVSSTGFLLGLLLFSVVLRQCSTADARPAAETGVTSDSGGVLWGNLQGLEDDTRAMAPAESKMLRGRKLGAEGNAVKREVMKVQGTSKSSAGANSASDGNCDHEGDGELDVECELSGRGLPSGDNFVDFIPFSSDYRGAKTHPPKNN